MGTKLHLLDKLSALLICGADTTAFLQGQLSNDIEMLTGEHCQFTSLSNPKGRVITLAYLVALDQGVLMILPKEMTLDVRDYLQRYVLRSKVTLAQAQVQISGTVTQPKPEEFQELTVVPLDAGRTLHFALNFGKPLPPGTTESDGPWNQHCIRHGKPWVQTETRETFVAQMLNLDLLDGISWSKGCYTGQEIIARVHYRGKNKRRMLGFSVQTSVTVLPGTQVVSEDKIVGTIVNAVQTGNTQELLTVLQLSALDSRLTIEGDTQAVLTAFDLPYSI